MGFVRVFVIVSALTLGAMLFGAIPASLPHPACHHTIQPVALHEQPGTLTGVYKPNTALQSAKRLLEGKVRGSESVTFSPSGKRVFFADKFGWIHAGHVVREGETVDVRLDVDSPFVQVKGRPLGVHAITETQLLLCDSVQGLVEVDLVAKTSVVIADRTKTRRKKKRTHKIVYANDLDVAEDGIVYFTDSTDIPVAQCSEGYYSTLRTFLLNLMEGRASGRLLKHDREKNTTTELLGNLWYANGVALAKDGSFVAVVETNGFRVHRYWLTGPREKRSDVMISNLPGFADGISTSSDGNFWIALVAPAFPFWNVFSNRAVRLAIAWLTEYVTIPTGKWGYVLKVSPEGEVLQVLSDIEGGFINSVSSITEHDGRLFLGNLVGDYVSVFDLKLLERETSTDDAPPTVHDEQEL